MDQNAQHSTPLSQGELTPTSHVNVDKQVAEVPSTPTPIERLTFYSEHFRAEQEWFWQRFVAFASLNGAALVLFSIPSVPLATQLLFARVGFALGLLWFYVQWASFSYVGRWKGPFHALRTELGFIYEDEGVFVFASRRWGIPSSTAVGLMTSAVVPILWAFASFPQLRTLVFVASAIRAIT